MPDPQPKHRTGIVAAIVLLVAVLAALAIVLDLGPFADEAAEAPDFLVSADEICAQAQDEFVGLQRTPPRTPADAAALTRELADIAQRELEEIRALPAPPELEPDLERYLDARAEGIELLREGADAAEAEDAEAYTDLQAQAARTQAKRRALARAVGLSRCSRPLRGAGA